MPSALCEARTKIFPTLPIRFLGEQTVSSDVGSIDAVSLQCIGSVTAAAEMADTIEKFATSAGGGYTISYRRTIGNSPCDGCNHAFAGSNVHIARMWVSGFSRIERVHHGRAKKGTLEVLRMRCD
jgi:hypothetical protein